MARVVTRSAAFRERGIRRPVGKTENNHQVLTQGPFFTMATLDEHSHTLNSFFVLTISLWEIAKDRIYCQGACRKPCRMFVSSKHVHIQYCICASSKTLTRDKKGTQSNTEKLSDGSRDTPWMRAEVNPETSWFPFQLSPNNVAKLDSWWEGSRPGSSLAS